MLSPKYVYALLLVLVLVLVIVIVIVIDFVIERPRPGRAENLCVPTPAITITSTSTSTSTSTESKAGRFAYFTMLTRRLALLLRIVQCSCVAGATYASESGSELPFGLHRSTPEIGSCRQLIVVTTPSWSEVNATVQLMARRESGSAPWRKVGTPFPAVVGRRGLAWGVGLHGSGEPGTPFKREGDQKSPAGVFRLYAVFGTATPEQVHYLRFPYERVDSTSEAVDDPRSKYYNRVVNRAAIKHPDWSSSESMLAVPSQYRLGLMIEHNWLQIPGLGSCIFLHVWNSNRTGTAGCTAVRLADLERLLHWLDAQENPLIVQLPLPEYASLKESWGLP
ncbi:MAG TPA: L,D-transpeptidase family protein [Chthoniobacterales bacterium]|nr:L,D-transpeptidase family protein [Chthoniobacterales bacterium]